MITIKHLFYSFTSCGVEYKGKFVLDVRFTEHQKTNEYTHLWTHRVALRNGNVAVIKVETFNKSHRRKVLKAPTLFIFNSNLTNMIRMESICWSVDMAPFDCKFESICDMRYAIQRFGEKYNVSFCTDYDSRSSKPEADCGCAFTSYDYECFDSETEARANYKRDKHELSMLKLALRERYGIVSKKVCTNGNWREGLLLNINFSDNLHLISS